jgi:hypothetical protein
MTKKETYKTKDKPKVVNEPLVIYEKKRITFSTIETQNDIQLKYAMNVPPIERLQLMRKLNDYAYKNFKHEKILTKPVKLIFTSYEYIPG